MTVTSSFFCFLSFGLFCGDEDVNSVMWSATRSSVSLLFSSFPFSTAGDASVLTSAFATSSASHSAFTAFDDSSTETQERSVEISTLIRVPSLRRTLHNPSLRNFKKTTCSHGELSSFLYSYGDF
eukprot:gnl/MRDRNA2_/MRDRNA2_63836_c0_seq2.p1 gnl/MRDRNA2_/MRDRNA2_63836_c0~~gnl/MRDRNA2_/MRDRNA2_63836_c0_seq2.p1  ORF type:complete len:125 (-),score=11.13 gnl/MRDRNA2_/MRDRNA2_63836_c0_seq2:23-397(-)